jgi:hypothetical protein
LIKEKRVVELRCDPDTQIIVATAGDGFASLGHAVHRVLITLGELGGADVLVGLHGMAGTGHSLAIEPREEFFRGRGRAEKQKCTKNPTHAVLIGESRPDKTE